MDNMGLSPVTVSFLNTNTGWVAGYSGTKVHIKKTTNKGLTWTLIKELDKNEYINNNFTPRPSIQLINEALGFIYYGNTKYGTSDGGSTWNRTFCYYWLNNNQCYQTIKFLNETIGFFTYTNPAHIKTGTEIYMTTDGGETFHNIYTSNNYSASYTYYTDITFSGNYAYLCGFERSQNEDWIKCSYMKIDVNTGSIITNFSSGRGGYKYFIKTNSGDIKTVGIKYWPDEQTNGSYVFSNIGDPNSNFTKICDNYDLNSLGGVSLSSTGVGYAYIGNKIYKSTNSGNNWSEDYTLPYSSSVDENNMVGFGDIVYCGNKGAQKIYYNNLNLHFNTFEDNLSGGAAIYYDGNTQPTNTPFNGYLRGGNVSFYAKDDYTDKIFYRWGDGSFLPTRNNYNLLNNETTINNYYKTFQKADNAWAINNANQTKSIRDTNTIYNGIIHQVCETIGGIFYSRSSNGGSNFQRDEVVNYSDFLSDASNNRNPSIALKRVKYSSGLYTQIDPEQNVAVVWERQTNGLDSTEIHVAERVANSIPSTGYHWERYSNPTSKAFVKFKSGSDFVSNPKIFILSSSGQSLFNSAIVVPHLEPNDIANNKKLIITVKCQNNSQNYVVDQGSDGLISNFAVSSPYTNNYGTFGLHIVYQKDNTENNIVYKYVEVGYDALGGILIQPYSGLTNENLGNLDGMRARFTPDISVQNGLPVVTYCGNYYDNRIIHYEDETVGDNMISLLKHTTITRIKTTNNGAWSEYERFTGLNPQENPNVEGSKNALAYLLSFRKNGSYFQYAKIYGLQQPYYCNPGSFSETDAKLVRGSYIGQFGSNFNPSLLTLSDPDNSRFTINERSFSIDPYSNGTDGYNNLDGVIEKDNTQYSLTLGPIIASNTTYGFEDDTPPQTVQNPVEFNETMVSAVFSLSNYDTLILGAHGKYATSFGQSMQPLKYHVNLVNSTTNQIHRELFRDTINVEDSVGIEFLRGYIINGISSGTDQFYVQMVVDTVDAGDGDYMMSGVYSDDTPPQGDAPINYKTKVFFENSSNSLTSGNQIPKEYSLSQNYPNPFNPSTTIKYSLPKDGLVTMKIYDLAGREVAKLVNEVKKAGNYQVQFNASNLASGVYFYRIQSNDFVMTKRMVLIK
jgi:hypothetical protein